MDVNFSGAFFFLINLIYFWLHWVFVAVHRLSLVAASGGYSSLQCAGFSLRWLLLLRSTGSRCTGFSSCSTQAWQLWLTGSRTQAHQLQRMGLVAPRHVGSSWTRARTCVPCTGRRILNHCATREAQDYFFLSEPWQFVSFNGFIHFKFIGIKLCVFPLYIVYMFAEYFQNLL